MRRVNRLIVHSWANAIRQAIKLHEDDVAYRLTVGLVRRLRELGEL
jgi:hypothetical protein